MTPRFQIKPLIVAFLTAVLMISALPAFAQAGSEGSIVVTALDSSGAVIPGAKLTLTALRTNDVRTAVTANDGSHTFVNLAIGTYRLIITKEGYSSREYSAIVVQASHVSDINATLPVGATTQTVRVNAEAIPVMDTTSNAIGSVIDVKQIEDLPLSGRNITSFAQQVPGYNGTFNGLPSTDQGNNINGMASSTSRMKFGGNMSPQVEPRLEDIEQMTVQTDQLDLNSGFGQATTQLNFVSRRGSNQFHGRLFEDFRNSWLNANSWHNNAVNQPRSKQIFNDFGGTVSGPAIHDKLFFFGSFATRRVPGGYTTSSDLFTADAQNGNYTYTGTDGKQHTVNVLSTAHQQNSDLPDTINQTIAAEQAAINSSVSSGTVSPTSDPNLNEIDWQVPNPTTYYYPAFRVDYNASQKARFYLSWLMTKQSNPASSAPPFPGDKFSALTAGNLTKNYTASFGFNYTFSPTVINQFTAGYLYDATAFAYNAKPLYATQPTVFWDYGDSGSYYQLPIDTYYPILNFDDAVTLQRKSHTFQFGASWYREQDHYWNAPGGFYQYRIGIANGDPVLSALTSDEKGGGTLPYANTDDLANAQALYGVLTGRIRGVDGENAYSIKDKKYSPTGTMSEYPLDEVASAWGFFFEDSWKLSPTFTLNYGLRWDIFAPEKDLTAQYHSADEASIYGPTAVGDLFKPGQLNGVQNPTIAVHDAPYAPWRVTPQPAIGFAWNPRVESGSIWHALLGNGDTVIRGGLAVRRFTEPYQYFWDFATDFGQFYYQQFNLIARNTDTTGSFKPGSLSLGDTMPAPILSPEEYVATASQSQFAFTGGPGVNGIEPNLKQPYSESWNFGIQRMMGSNLALEVRYNGNRTIHQWISINPNETNIFENGFLKDFQNAQKNLAASGGKSFSSSYGNPTPILDAAFGGPNASEYKSGQFITYLNNGRAGSMADVISGVNGNQPYFCNLVGASFAPCGVNLGYVGAGAGYPINFFQANPYAAGDSTGELVSKGYSNYNALQVDLRQGNWHGLQYDANYTWSHSLGVASPNDWTGAYTAFTLRNMGLSYGPSLFDISNVLHFNGTYDLPFGKGRQFLNGNRFLDETVGGWTIGTITTWQSGSPFRLTGGNRTFNNTGDGGIVLNGVTASQLQNAVGVHRAPGQSFVNILDPKYLASPTGGRANSQFITPNAVAGTFGQIVYLHGPRSFTQDISLGKAFPIRESMRFKLQASFLNAWNHPTFGNSTGSILSSGFGHGGPSNGARTIDLRANFEF
ncbi:MAG TPA: carboxypeptidase-like regulatory domain-containing protein [Acidobacteriaceae bacterium]|nr:carboxypeptidase-like regulatory domain-containing protein [Acidobacteriaceae bacterium]